MNDPKPELVRTFFAALLPSAAMEVLLHAQNEMRRRCERSGLALRFMTTEQIHLTLKFLGDTDQDLLPELSATLSSLGSLLPPLATSLQRFNAFPSQRRANVVVACLSDADARFRDLAKALDDRLEPRGFMPERRAFVPHVTLARSRRPVDVRALLTDLEFAHTAFAIAELVLFRSTLGAKGSTYTRLATVELRNPR